NRAGALSVLEGAMAGSVEELVREARAGALDAVVVLSARTGETSEMLSGLDQVPVIALATHVGAWLEVARVILPVAAHGRVDGSFVNAKGVTQRFRRAVVSAARDVAPAWERLSDLAQALGKNLPLDGVRAMGDGLLMEPARLAGEAQAP